MELSNVHIKGGDGGMGRSVHGEGGPNNQPNYITKGVDLRRQNQ